MTMSFMSLVNMNTYSIVAVKDGDHVVGLVLDGDKPAGGISVVAGNSTNVTHDGFFSLPYHRNFTVKTHTSSMTFSLSGGAFFEVRRIYAAFNESRGTAMLVTDGDPPTLFVVTNESGASINVCNTELHSSGAFFSVNLCDAGKVEVDNLTLNVDYFDLVSYQGVRLLGPFPLLVPLLVFIASCTTDSKLKTIYTIIGSVAPTLSAAFPLILFKVNYAEVLTIEMLVFEVQLSFIMSLLSLRPRLVFTLLSTGLIFLFALNHTYVTSLYVSDAYLLIPGMTYLFPVNAINLGYAVLSIIPWVLLYFMLTMFKRMRK